MRVQSWVGFAFSAFCGYLLVVNPIGRLVAGEPVFIPTDWIILLVGGALLGTAYWDSAWSRGLQVLAFLTVSAGAMANNSPTVGVIVFNMTFFLAMYYGIYVKHPLPKILVTGMFFASVIWSFDKSTTNDNLLATINWIGLFTLQVGFLWLLYYAKMSAAVNINKTLARALEEKERGNAP